MLFFDELPLIYLLLTGFDLYVDIILYVKGVTSLRCILDVLTDVSFSIFRSVTLW